MSSGRDLRSLGPLSMIDRAIGLARQSASEVAVPAWTGGALVAAVVLAIYYLERVEGIHTLRLPLALLLVLAFAARSVLLVRAAARATQRLWGAQPSPEAGRTVDVVRTSMAVGLGLWVWSWLLVAGSLAGVLGVLAVLPFFTLRGAIAPSWLARAACEPEAGFRALVRAGGDSDGRRFEGVLVEAMTLAGALGLAINLYALVVVALVLGRAFLGLELASIETFLSPNNTFVLLTIGAAALVAVEPLRAALSALAYVDARVRADGLDLRALVEDAIEHAAHRGPRGARAAAVLLAVVLGGSVAHAQEPPPTVVSADAEVEQRAIEILGRSEFRELADHRGEGLRDLIERLVEWLLRGRDDLPRIEAPNLSALSLPGAEFFIAAGVALLVLVGVYLWITRRRDRLEAKKPRAAVTSDPRDRPPAAFLDDAARLAEAGELREALRALYLATLVALDRRRLIAFDPHLTNWQYLRQMPRGGARESFASFTRLFDHKWYGLEPTTLDDYERCRALAREIVGEAAAEAA